VACIFASGVCKALVSNTTWLCISGVTSRRPCVSNVYQSPICLQDSNPWFVAPGGKIEISIREATPCHGGMAGSSRIGGTSAVLQEYKLLEVVAAMSG